MFNGIIVQKSLKPQYMRRPKLCFAKTNFRSTVVFLYNKMEKGLYFVLIANIYSVWPVH